MKIQVNGNAYKASYEISRESYKELSNLLDAVRNGEKYESESYAMEEALLFLDAMAGYEGDIVEIFAFADNLKLIPKTNQAANDLAQQYLDTLEFNAQYKPEVAALPFYYNLGKATNQQIQAATTLKRKRKLLKVLRKQASDSQTLYVANLKRPTSNAS